MNATRTDNLFHSKSLWCWHNERKANEAGYTLFRRRFRCKHECEMHIAVSADNRYNFYLDGNLLGRGPCRGDLQHYSYEEYTQLVPEGEHALAIEVVVWQGGWRNSAAAWSELHSGGGLLIAGFCGTERLDTPLNWLCDIDQGRRPLEWKESWTAEITTPLPPMDKIDFNSHNPDWMILDYDDSSWKPPALIGSACLSGKTFADPPTPWLLSPASIEQLTSQFTPIAGILDAGVTSLNLSEGRINGKIPAGNHKILLDIGRNQTNIVHISGCAGRGRCRIAYAESLFKDGHKSVFPKITEGEIGQKGYADILVFSGNHWHYDSFWYRSGRFIELDFELDEELKLENFSLEFFCYNLQLLADFKTPKAPCLEKIWNVAWHTARCCAHEHYEDCPYYEQLQYTGDTRIQALVSYAAAGEEKLGRQALRHFDWSRTPIGITQSRYPNMFEQVIPEFSLIWVLMVYDHYRYFGKKDVISEHMRGICGVMELFEEHRLKNGLIGKVDGWNFSDWTDVWPAGKSDRGTGEPETILNLFYAETCRTAEKLCEELNLFEKARLFAERRVITIDALNVLCFDSKRGLYRDVPSHEWFSCHTNAMAIIADVAPTDLSLEIGNRLVEDISLTQGTLYFDFYILEALKKCGLAEAFLKKFSTWQKILERGFTTFPECPSDNTRSECHAWSASPVYEFITGFLGISPDLPGFKKIEVAPLIINGFEVEGKAPIGNGRILSIKVKDGKVELCANAAIDVCLLHPSGNEELVSLKPNVKEKNL